MKFGPRFFRKPYPAVDVFAGRYMIRIALSARNGGTFGNGSRRHSGWHRWTDDL